MAPQTLPQGAVHRIVALTSVTERQLHCQRAGRRRQRRRSRCAALSFQYKAPPFNPEPVPDLGLDIPKYDAEKNEQVDVVIAGAGPAGIATAARISSQGLRVVVVDPAPLAHWPNNYGVWVDEFRAMGLDDCFEKEWSRANVWLGENDERFLSRPYARVDRLKLKRKLIQSCKDSGVKFYIGKAKECHHGRTKSTLECQDGLQLTGRTIVDATGHARRLTEMDGHHNPGLQAAYGIMADVDEHPFDLETMLFMDWRDKHLWQYQKLKDKNKKLPTFLYAMPFNKTRIFVEETSLVARPGLSFDDLKERLYARLQHLGITVRQVVEEEYCLIPMGGTLPKRDQRVIGVGGTAGLVHPSTGYMVARTLGAVPQLADRVVDELMRKLPEERERQDEAIARRHKRMWESIWPIQRLHQRAFMNFGMEVILKLDLEQTRQFFSAFFALSDFHWRGFLSSQLSFRELIVFGLALFKHACNDARVTLVSAGLPLFPGMIAEMVQAQRHLEPNELGKPMKYVPRRAVEKAAKSPSKPPATDPKAAT